MFIKTWVVQQCVGYSQTAGYYSMIKKGQLLIGPITWINLRNIVLSKVDKPKRVHMVWFHLYDGLEQTKVSYSFRVQVTGCLRLVRLTEKICKETFGVDGNILYPAWDGGCTAILICWNSFNCPLKGILLSTTLEEMVFYFFKELDSVDIFFNLNPSSPLKDK